MTSYRIPNSYQTPIGSALGNLMTAFASMPSPEDRALKAAQLDQIQSTAALNRQKLVDSQREAQMAGEYGNKISGVINKIFSPPPEQPRPTPDSVGPMPAVPADEHVRSNLGALAGAIDPKQVGHLPELFLSMFGNAPGTSQGAVERSQIGAGKPYASTQTAVDAERERKYQADMDRNMRAEKSANYAAARQAETQDRIDQRQGRLVADPKSPTGISWFAPGNAIHGMPGVPPQASTSLQNKAAERTDSLNVFEQNLTDFENLAINNPTALGFAGDAARVGAGLVAQGQSMGQNLGIDLSPMIAKAQSALGPAGAALPALAEKASQLDTYGTLIPRLAAKAFGESTGSGFSNKDAERYAKAFGESPIASVSDLKARIQSVRQMLATDMAIYGNRAGAKASPGLGSSVTNTFAPQPAAPAAPAAPAPVQKWGRDANGRPVRVQ